MQRLGGLYIVNHVAESVYRKIFPFTRQIQEIRYLDIQWVLIMMDCTSIARIQINLACFL